MKKERLEIRTTDEQINRLDALADALKVPRSEIVRDAIDEKIDELIIERPELKEQIPQAA